MVDSASRSAAIGEGAARAWVLACRPKTLTAAVAPVLVGTAVAFHTIDRGLPLPKAWPDHIRWGPALATLLGAMFLQVGSNLANDVFDYEKGADTEHRLGPTRAVQAGLLSSGQVKSGMYLAFALALVVGGYLAMVAGWPIVAIGLASIIAAVAYTAGPYPLGYNGLGDVFVLVFFGWVAVGGTVYVHTGLLPHWAWLVASAVGLSAANILVVNNVRDRTTDETAGKRTLAVRFGRQAAEAQYLVSYFFCYSLPLALWALMITGPAPLLCWLTLPIAGANVRQLKFLEGRALNGTLERTAKLVFLYALTLAAGIALDTLRS